MKEIYRNWTQEFSKAELKIKNKHKSKVKTISTVLRGHVTTGGKVKKESESIE